MSLSRQDVILGRALLSWGWVGQRQLQGCADEVRLMAAQGRPVTLAQVLIQRGLLSIDRYHAVVQRLRQVYLNSSTTPQQLRVATEQVPFVNPSGRYTRSFQVPVDLESSTVDRAVSSWRGAAKDVLASGSQIEPSGSNPAARSPNPASGSSGAGSRASARLTPTGKKRRPDKPIRQRLKVPEGAERFPIGKWMVEEYLASGNWGIVYRVTLPGSGGSSGALKVLKELNPSDQVRKRFVREAKTMAKLSHPGIVRVYDAGVAEGLLWFVMDFLDGKDLEAVLKERKRIPVPEALRLMSKLCEAVAYAHSRNVLHRDLKPENVVIRGDGTPILTDFGLAKDVASGSQLTAEGQRLGTPFYMAPELLLEAEKATQVSEVYALGAMFYKLVAGQVPFYAKGVVALMNKIEEGKPKPLREVCPAASKKLEKLIMSCLHRKPKKRPQTVAEFAKALAKAV